MSKSGYTCIRYLFCILNLVLWLSGCGLLGIGLWLRFGVESFQIKAPWIPVATAIIVLGTLVFVISFFGCCGACYQNKCMLVTYLSLVVIMFLIEFVAATLVFVYREQIHDQVNEEFLNGIHHHYERSTGEGLKEMWDKIHTELNCCGLKGYEDWYDIDAWPGQKNVPDSCCIPNFQNSTGCGAAGNQDKWYSVGCSDRIQMWLVSRLHLVGIAGLLIAFIQVAKNEIPIYSEGSNMDIVRVALKLPLFWKNQPDLWFCQVDANFEMTKITSDQTKFYFILCAIDGY